MSQQAPNKDNFVSIVLPVFNEEESLPLLNEKIIDAMREWNSKYEIIYVDDGSKDQSAKVIRELASKHSIVTGVVLRRNFGQSAATAAGIDQAKGDIIVIMDSDLQNDPADIPMLIKRIENGADIVSGWRKDRKDNAIFRNIPSWIANKLIKKISGLKIHDLGCSLKAYRREIIKEVKLYGETHRFIAIYANMIGGRVEEVVVKHHSRKYRENELWAGACVQSSIGSNNLKYMLSYATKPVYFFGKMSLWIAFFGFCSMAGMFIHKFAFKTSFVRSPFLLLSSMIFLVAFQTLITGVVADILMRVYHESQQKPIYYVRAIHRRSDKTESE